MTKKAARPPRRLMITKNLILMLVVVVIVFLAVYAWYANTSTVTASGTTVSAANPESVQVARPFRGSYPLSTDSTESDFDSEKDGFRDTINFPDTGNITDNMFKDVTSDGKSFILPTFISGEVADGRRVVSDGEWSTALSSKTALNDDVEGNEEDYNYLSTDFYVRSSSPDVKVKSTSYLVTASESETPQKPLTGSENSLRKNGSEAGIFDKDYGVTDYRISSDAIAGAIRVSLVGAQVKGREGTNERTDIFDNNQTFDAASAVNFLWLPRPDMLLNTSNDKSAWRLTTGITSNSGADALTTFRHGCYIPLNNTTKGVRNRLYYDSALSEVSGMTSGGAEENTRFHVSKTTPSGSSYPILGADADVSPVNKYANYMIQDGQSRYYIYKYTLNIWIEGEDKEARRALDKGEFSIHLDFGV